VLALLVVMVVLVEAGQVTKAAVQILAERETPHLLYRPKEIMVETDNLELLLAVGAAEHLPQGLP
jgi:hypothetical protein